MTTDRPGVETIDAVEARFDTLDAGLVYVDGPLEGFVRERATARLYAFRVTPIIEDRLWHWTLLPANSEADVISKIFLEATARRPSHWISLLEDRRGKPASVTLVVFTTSVPVLPKGVRER
jgi:hypothetical protein